MLVVALSTTCTGTLTCSAACLAASAVADIVREMCRLTIASAPALTASWKVQKNAPGSGGRVRTCSPDRIRPMRSSRS